MIIDANKRNKTDNRGNKKGKDVVKSHPMFSLSYIARECDINNISKKVAKENHRAATMTYGFSESEAKEVIQLILKDTQALIKAVKQATIYE